MSHLATRPDAAARPLTLSTRSRLISDVMAPAAVAVLTLAYAIFFGWLSLERYWAYDMHALDMGNMAQAAWNTIHGHPFRFTNMRMPYFNIEAWGTTTRLSFHVETLFPVIALVYLVYPHPESLLVLQTVALAAGAIPVYLLARDVLERAWRGLVFALAYLLFPTLEGMNLYEFHPVALATPLLLCAFLFAWRRQYVPFVLCCLAAMGTKEEVGLTVAMFGLYVALVNRDRRVGLAMAAAGVGYSLFAALVIEHHFRPPGSHSYLRTRYGYLGHGIHGAIHTIVHDPGVFFRVAGTWAKLGYVVRLLLPVGFMALLAPLALLLGLPTLVINLLSTDFHMTTGLGDNSAELVSVMLIAGILGARRAIDLLEHWMPAGDASLLAGAAVLAGALWSQHATGFTPLGNAYQIPAVGPHQHLADRFVSMVPPSAAVSTQDQLDPHLSSRRYLYLFLDDGRNPRLVPANYILLDVSATTYPLPSYQLYHPAVQHINQPGWGVAAADDGLILIEKGAPSRRIPSQFYRYAYADGISIPRRMRAQEGGLRLLGYTVRQTDLPNHHVPNLAYTFYLQPAHRIGSDLQPVVYEVMKDKLVACSDDPLGLAWLPTSRWSTGHRYQIRMRDLETNWQSPGTAQFYVELRPLSVNQHPDCAHLWAGHGRLFPIGTRSIDFL